MTELWTKWEGQVINGVFPLRRLLSASHQSAVFLTEYKAQNLANAALKLVPAIPTLTQAQLSYWTTAVALSHPHLIQLFETGRCQLGDLQFLFVVMEYAEQTLSQILPIRGLTPGEVSEMLLPTLGALGFLHPKNLVQGRLKPSNILVVNDQLKLASDAVRPAGEVSATIAQSSVYDPPEAEDGSFSAAGDIWGLGITLVEALTQHPPSWPDSHSETIAFSAALPPEYAKIVRQCLHRNPADRPTVAELETQIKPAPQLPAISVPEPPVSVPERPISMLQPAVPTPKIDTSVPEPLVSVPERAAVSMPNTHTSVAKPPVSVSEPPLSMPKPAASVPPVSSPKPPVSQPRPLAIPKHLMREVPARTAPSFHWPKQRWFLSAIAVLLVVVVAVWAGLHARSSQTSLEPSAPPTAAAQNPETSLSASTEVTAPSSTAKSADPGLAPSRQVTRPSIQTAQSSANRSPSVLHEEIPDVPRGARVTVHGHIKVAVRVTVDSSGNVVDETLERPGPSKYFARLATKAARKWKFAPADNEGSRKLLLRFEFSRAGATGHAVTSRS
jgi:TonB family protein